MMAIEFSHIFIWFVSCMAGPAVIATVALYSSSPTIAHTEQAVDLTKVRGSILKVIEDDQEKRGDGTSLMGTFIRLASHCAGTYAKDDKSG